jgi:hypothetical protein
MGGDGQSEMQLCKRASVPLVKRGMRCDLGGKKGGRFRS